jgi:hypothetical protein
MANAVITVLEADGVTETDVTVLDVGRQAEAASKSVAISTEDKVVLDAIAEDLVTLSDAVSNDKVQVDVASMPTVTVAEHAVTNAGTFAVQVDGAALTALQLIDDAIKTDDSAFVPATDEVMMIGAVFDDSGPDSVNEGDAGAVRMSANRSQYVNIRDNAGNERGLNIDAQGNITVEAIRTSVTPGTAAANLGKAEDAAHSTGDTGVMLLAVRRDTSAASSDTTGDYEPLSTDSTGKLWVRDPNISTLLTAVVEVAHDEVDTGNPSKIGGYASVSPPADVSAAADRVNAWFTLGGSLTVVPQPHTTGGLSIFRSLDLDETEEAVKATAGCLYKLRITNRATTARYVKIYNDTVGTVIVGTTTPVDTIVVPGCTNADVATVITESFGGMGLAFSTAITVAATTGFADNDTGAPAANDVIITAYYK